MAETRSDVMQDQRDQLATALRYVLANNSVVKGRAIAEAALFNVPPAMFPGEANIMQMALDAQAASLAPHDAAREVLDRMDALDADPLIAKKDYGLDPIYKDKDGVLRWRREDE